MAEQPSDELYDLAPEPPPQPVVPVADPPTAPGTAPVGRAPIAYRSGPVGPAVAEPETIKNLYMPLWLLGGGVAIEVVGALIRGPFPRAVVLVGLNLILGTAVMLVGILLAARWRAIDLGHFWTAVFKLAAISVAPGAAVTLLSPALSFLGLLGGLLGLILEFVLYFALIGALFDLDQSDTWYVVLVIFLVRLVLYFAVLAWVMSRA